MIPKHSSSPRMSLLSKNGPGKPQDYSDLLAEVKQRIRSAQYAALNAVNQELAGLYRDIGRMKAFFEAHIGPEKLQPLIGEIAWSHNPAIMNKCKDPLQREFYIRMTRPVRLVQKCVHPSNRKPELPKISAGAAMTPRER